MGKEQDIAIAKERARDGENLYWFGYATALDGYNATEAWRLIHKDPTFLEDKKASGNGPHDLARARSHYRIYTDKKYFWFGYVSALEGLDPTEAEKRNNEEKEREAEIQREIKSRRFLKGREQDIAIAQERGKGGNKSLYWHGYARALEGYTAAEADRFKSVDPCLWGEIKPSGNQTSSEIEYSINKAKLNTSADCFFWIGFAAGIQGLNLDEAEKCLANDPRSKIKSRKYRPFDGEKVRNGLWSFIIAFFVSFVLANMIALSYGLLLWLANHNACGLSDFKSMSSYLWVVFMIMAAETLILKTMYITWLCARKYHSLGYVIFRGLIGAKIPGGYCGPTFLYVSKN